VFVQQVFDIAPRQRETDVDHHRQAVDLGRGLGVAESEATGPTTHVGHSDRLKKSSSYNAPSQHPMDDYIFTIDLMVV
jgi:hypothetical protein